MRALRGRVRGDHVETEGVLPDGAEVIVLTGGDLPAFELAEDEIIELAARMKLAGTAPTESAASVLARLRSRR